MRPTASTRDCARDQGAGQPDQELKVPRQRADLAAEFVARSLRQAVVGQRPAVVNHPPPLHGHRQRPVHIVEQRARRDGPEQFPSARR